jgi:hypothetical protein
MRRWLLWIPAVLLLAAGAVSAEETVGLEGEGRILSKPVRFWGELGFNDFLEEEPTDAPPFISRGVPRAQRPLYEFEEWEERVFPKFALHISMTEYWFGRSTGRNLVGRYFRSGYGPELTAYIHIDEGVDGFFTMDWAWHEGRATELSGVRTRLSGFSSYSFLWGIRPFTPFESVFGGSDILFFKRSKLFLRVGAGGTIMGEIRRVHPAPEEVFWKASTLATLHLTLGLEFQVLGEFYVFAENGIRAYSPPNPNSSLRPENEVGPFAFLVWQAGAFVRF